MLLNMVWVRGIYSHNYCIPLLNLVQGEIFNLTGNPQADRQEFISCLLVSLIISKFQENLPDLPDGLASLRIVKPPLGPEANCLALALLLDWLRIPCIIYKAFHWDLLCHFNLRLIRMTL